MNRVLLQTVGLLALLGFAAVGAGGLLLVKDRVTLVVRSGGSHDEDPASQASLLLRDEVQNLRGEFERLGRALNEQLPELARRIDDAGRARSDELARTLHDAGASAAAHSERLEHQLVALEQRLLALAAAVAETARPASQPQAPDQLAAAVPLIDGAEPAVHAPDPPPPADAVTTPPPASAPSPAAAPSASKSFLAFQLPTQSFSFAGRQRFVLLPELSRVGFDAKSTLHDFTGVTSRVRGEFVADLAAPEREPVGQIACEAKTLVTGVDGRDEGLREHLDIARYPEIVFVVDGFEPARVDPAKQTLAGELRGRMRIRGVERAVRMPVQVSVDPARRVEIHGDMPLKLTDYQVPVPSKLGLISMQDEVKVWIALRARSTGAAQ